MQLTRLSVPTARRGAVLAAPQARPRIRWTTGKSAATPRAEPTRRRTDRSDDRGTASVQSRGRCSAHRHTCSMASAAPPSWTRVDRPTSHAAACVPGAVTELSVSVVSYRTPAPLRQCLSALERERAGIELDVTVVDNASGDGSAEMVAEHFPWVRLIRNDRNVGFGAAHNQALRAAGGRYLLILNSDATPSPGALRTL